MSEEEQEDFNAFNHWDCFGAAFMLGITPAMLNFVFNDHEIVSTVVLAGGGTLAALVVWLLAVVVRGRIIGTLLNWVGCVLTAVFWGIAVYHWFIKSPEEATSGEAEPLPALPAETAAE